MSGKIQHKIEIMCSNAADKLEQPLDGSVTSADRAQLDRLLYKPARLQQLATARRRCGGDERIRISAPHGSKGRQQRQ
jgi:hypothetical protein